MNNECIEIIERIIFENGDPKLWDRSLDGGKTWTTIDHPHENIPFVIVHAKEAWERSGSIPHKLIQIIRKVYP